ncbi:hypothetical protein ACE2AJ_00425 [Aquihabitans daechungensis]|uniref:hypothetical protein n=1 Tax=Aquihabitans daechungensis TaxID=1052257 RepID=UPI003BA02053
MAFVDDADDRLEEAVGWAVEHCAAEVNLDSTFVVIGDPEVLWSAPALTPDVLDGRPWCEVELPAGRVLAIGGTVGEDGPWMWVVTTSDGPVDSVTIQPSIWTNGAEAVVPSSITLRSGRIVVGEPDTLRAWGPTVDVEDGGVAQVRTGFDEPEPRYLGLVAVIRIPAVESCPVEVTVTEDGSFHSLAVRPPRPSWVPQTLDP